MQLAVPVKPPGGNWLASHFMEEKEDYEQTQ